MWEPGEGKRNGERERETLSAWTKHYSMQDVARNIACKIYADRCALTDLALDDIIFFLFASHFSSFILACLPRWHWEENEIGTFRQESLVQSKNQTPSSQAGDPETFGIFHASLGAFVGGRLRSECFDGTTLATNITIFRRICPYLSISFSLLFSLFFSFFLFFVFFLSHEKVERVDYVAVAIYVFGGSLAQKGILKYWRFQMSEPDNMVSKKNKRNPEDVHSWVFETHGRNDEDYEHYEYISYLTYKVFRVELEIFHWSLGNLVSVFYTWGIAM